MFVLPLVQPRHSWLACVWWTEKQVQQKEVTDSSHHRSEKPDLILITAAVPTTVSPTTPCTASAARHCPGGSKARSHLLPSEVGTVTSLFSEEVWWQPVCHPDLPHHSCFSISRDPLGRNCDESGSLLHFDEITNNVRVQPTQMLFTDRTSRLGVGELGEETGL